MLDRYQPSGQFSALSILMIVPLAAILGVVGFVYQLGCKWIPLIYLNLLLSVGFGLLAGLLVKKALLVSKTRNVGMAGAIAIVAALAGVAATHGWAYMLTCAEFKADLKADEANKELPDEAFDAYIEEKFTFGDFIDARVEQGWSIGRVTSSGSGAPLSGVFVYLIWLVEAGIIAGGALVGARKAARTPFCEACESWTRPKDSATFPNPSDEAVASVRSASAVADVFAVDPRPATGTASALAYAIHCCPSCGRFQTLDVAVETSVTDKRGKVKTKRDLVHTGVLLKPGEESGLATLRERVLVPVAEAEPSAEAPPPA